MKDIKNMTPEEYRHHANYEYKMNNELFSRLAKALSKHDVVTESKMTEKEWLDQFEMSLKNAKDYRLKIDFKTVMLLLAELALAAYKSIEYKENLEKIAPADEITALKDILWLKSNPNLFNKSKLNDRIENIIRHVCIFDISAVSAWKMIAGLIGSNVFNRKASVKVDKNEDIKNITHKLTDNVHENYAAAKVLLGTVLEHVLIEKIQPEIMREFQKVVDGRVQAALVLGDLLRRYPQIFPEHLTKLIKHPILK